MQILKDDGHAAVHCMEQRHLSAHILWCTTDASEQGRDPLSGEPRQGGTEG